MICAEQRMTATDADPTTERQDARVLEGVSEKALGSTNCKNVFAWCASLKNTVPPDVRRRWTRELPVQWAEEITIQGLEDNEGGTKCDRWETDLPVGILRMLESQKNRLRKGSQLSNIGEPAFRERPTREAVFSNQYYLTTSRTICSWLEETI